MPPPAQLPIPPSRTDSGRTVPVVAQGSLEMRRIADALLDLGQVLGGVVAGRPVRPDPVDEREVIGPDDILGHPLILEVPEVERPLDLVVGDDVLAEDREWRDVEYNAPPPPIGFLPGRAPAPAPQSCAIRMASLPPSTSCSAGCGSAAIVLEWIWCRSAGSSVGANPRLNGAAASTGLSKRREQVAVAVGRVGETVYAQREQGHLLRMRY